MSSIQQRLISGRAVQVTSPLPITASTKPVIVLMGASQDFLARVLNSGLLPAAAMRTVVAPRLVPMIGRAQRVPSFGSTEAMVAKRAGLVNAVYPEVGQAGSNGFIIDLTPLMLSSRDVLARLTPTKRHELIAKALQDYAKLLDDVEGTFVTIAEVVQGHVPAKRRLVSDRLLESTTDHLLHELVSRGSNSPVVKDPSLLLLVASDIRHVVRIDPSDDRTATQIKQLNAIASFEKVASGELSVDDSETAPDAGGSTGNGDPLKGVPKFSPDDDVSQLAAALGAGEEPVVKLNAEERRRQERVAKLRQAQEQVVYRGRNLSEPLSNLVAPRPPSKLKVKKAKGEFLDASIAEVSFDAITQSYLDGGDYDRDTARIIASLSADPVNPMFVERIERNDTSDSLTNKETLTVQYRDSAGKSTTVRFDLPLISRDGYMLLNGVKFSITKQILALPIIKVRPSEVLVTTAYNKATVERFGQNASPRSVYIRKLASLLDKERPRGVRVDLASATAANSRFLSSIEYDDIARSVRSIKTVDAEFHFARDALDKTIAKSAPWATSALAVLAAEGSHPVGFRSGGKEVLAVTGGGDVISLVQGKDPVVLEDDLAQVIYSAVAAVVPAESLPAGPSTAPRKYAYSRVKMLSQYLPTSVIVGYTEGLVPMLRRAGIEFRLLDKEAYRRGQRPGTDVIKFSDAVIEYSTKRIRDLLLVNGMKEMDTSKHEIADFAASGIGWVEHIADRLGSPGHAKGLLNYQASFIDPMTRDILEELKLPTDMSGVLLHASALLEDNRYSEANDLKNYRMRGPELVNSLLYKALHREMQKVRDTRESASPQKLSMSQNEVIRQIKEASNVEEVAELNPLLEAELRGKATWTGAAGGLGDGRTVNRAMRAYHPSMHGIFGFYSPDSSEIGVKRTLAFGASVVDARGKMDLSAPKDKASRVLALGELISPFTAQHADAPRIGMQSKQGTHTLPILRHTPLLVGSGAERSLVNAIGQTFAYKARTGGKVESIDTKNGVIRLKYDDGKAGLIDINPRSIKNSGGGFFVTSQLELNPGLRVGSRFESDQVLAHDPSFFSPRPDGSVAYKTGLLVKTAVIALDQTYEDSLMVTERLTRDTAATVTMARAVSLGSKANLQKIAKVGDAVNPNSALAVFENVTDDADVSDLLKRVGKEFDEAIADLTRNTAVAKYKGQIIEIRTYYNKELDDLSPSLRAFIKRQEKEAEDRRKASEGAPTEEKVRVNAPVRINGDKVSGEIVDGVLIMFMIKILDVAAAGDKYVVSSPLKGIVSRVFEAGEEPVAEDGDQVDYIMSPLSIVSRMTTDCFMQMWSNAVLVGLKEAVLKIADE